MCDTSRVGSEERSEEGGNKDERTGGQKKEERKLEIKTHLRQKPS